MPFKSDQQRKWFFANNPSSSPSSSDIQKDLDALSYLHENAKTDKQRAYYADRYHTKMDQLIYSEAAEKRAQAAEDEQLIKFFEDRIYKGG